MGINMDLQLCLFHGFLKWYSEIRVGECFNKILSICLFALAERFQLISPKGDKLNRGQRTSQNFYKLIGYSYVQNGLPQPMAKEGIKPLIYSNLGSCINT